MGAESFAFGSLITTIGGLMMQIISKTKCVYCHTEEGCSPACAFMDSKHERETELTVHTVTANDLDLLYVGNKQQSL